MSTVNLEENKEKHLPLLPLRDVVMFPYMVAPLFVGRERSIKALEEAMKGNKEIFLSAQKEAKVNDPKENDIFRSGTIGVIVQMLRLPDGTVKVLVEGKGRGKITGFVPDDRFFVVKVEEQKDEEVKGIEADALTRSVVRAFEGYTKLNKKIPNEVLATITSMDDVGRLSDTIVAHLNLKLQDKQSILEILDPLNRLEKLYGKMQEEVEILEIEKRIGKRVKKQMEKAQREYYLTEQMKAIQKELGEKDDLKTDIQEFEEGLKTKGLPEEIEKGLSVS